MDRAKYAYTMKNRYANHTTGYTEYICVQTNLYDTNLDYDLLTNCTDLGMKWYHTDSEWASLTADEQARASITIGCSQCESGSVPVSYTTLLGTFGIYFQECIFIDDST